MLAIAVVAVVISLAAFGVSVYSLVASRERDRRDLFLEMHHRLTDKELQEGRRLLFEKIESVDDVRLIRKADQASAASINRALTMFELLAFYVESGYVDKQLMLEEWGHTFAKAWSHGCHFVEERLEREQTGWSGWPHLQTLGPEAQRWAADHPPRLLLERAKHKPVRSVMGDGDQF